MWKPTCLWNFHNLTVSSQNAPVEWLMSVVSGLSAEHITSAMRHLLHYPPDPRPRTLGTCKRTVNRSLEQAPELCWNSVQRMERTWPLEANHSLTLEVQGVSSRIMWPWLCQSLLGVGWLPGFYGTLPGFLFPSFFGPPPKVLTLESGPQEMWILPYAAPRKGVASINGPLLYKGW